MALSNPTATALVDAIEDVAEEVETDACAIICEAKALICANPQLTVQCARITQLAIDYNCNCPGEGS